MTALTKQLIKPNLFLKTLSRQKTDQVPFWFMRQAGRYLPEYRKRRAEAGSFLDLCFNPDFATEVTLQPLKRFDMDGAILFSDILVTPFALGQDLSFQEGEGPQLGKIDSVLKIDQIDFKTFDEKLEKVYQAIHQIQKALPEEKALIGFAGAPWTLACYMVQGHGGREFYLTKEFAFKNLEIFDRLIDILTEATSHYLIEQIKNGVDVVQIFDSWSGLLSEEFFDRWVTQPTKKIVDTIHKAYPDFPIIGFPRSAGSNYKAYATQTGVTCMGLDQYISLEESINQFGGKLVLQGNLDPTVLFAGGDILKKEALRILDATKDIPFIFNLGHGVIKETPPENVLQLSEIIKSYRK